MLEFGQIIKKKREEKGWTQKTLGEKLYVSNKAISRWENNQSYPDITMLLNLAKVLELDYQELLEGSDYTKKIKKIKQKKLFFLIVFFLIALGAFGLIAYESWQKEQIYDKGINFLVSKNWNSYEISRFSSYDNDAYFEEHISFDYETNYAKEQLLVYLDVDHWEEIEHFNLEYPLYRFRIMVGDYKEDFLFYEMEDVYYVKVEESGEIYRLDNDYPLENLDTALSRFSLYDFVYDHQIYNETNFRRLTEEEVQEINIAHDGFDPLLNEEYYSQFQNIYGYDDMNRLLTKVVHHTQSNKYYFLIASQVYDIYSMTIEDGVLYLSGEARKFNQPYLCVFEIRSGDEIKKVMYKGEENLLNRKNI